MAYTFQWPRPVRYLQCILCVTFALSLLILPQHVFAHGRSTSVMHTAADDVTFRVSMGFSSRFRDGNWVPVHVTLQNTGSDFTGTIAVDVPAQFSGANNTSTIATYRTPITLPTDSKKQVTLYAPLSFGTPGVAQNVTVTLLDTHGQRVGTPQITRLNTLQSSEFFVGVLSDTSNSFGSLSGLTLPGQASSMIVEPLNATTMPERAATLDNFNLLVLDNFTTSTLSSGQLDALQQWVHHGGTLVIAGGPEWRRTVTSLPSNFIPITLSNTTMIPAGTRLIPIDGSSIKDGADQNNAKEGAPSPVIISTGTATRGTVLLTAGPDPLLVQARIGEGNVFYLAFDPTLAPIVGWSGASSVWKGIVLRTLGDAALTQSQNQTNGNSAGVVGTSKVYSQALTGVLQSLLPNAYPSIWLILVLLLSYILVLGPLRLLLVRRLKKRDWSWRIALATIVVFSLLTYGFALQQKGTTIVNDSISIVQLGDSTTPNANAHITTYLGVFVPNQGDFQIHVPGESLIQPNQATSQYQSTDSSMGQTTITTQQNATNVTLQGVDIWTLRSIVSERDRQLQGNITSHLSVTSGTLTGTVTNTLPYTLEDAGVLIGNQYVPLERLGVGETKHIRLALTSPSLSNYPPQSLVSQIAAGHGQPSFNGPTNGGPIPQDEIQRRLSVLFSLSNVGSGSTYCNTNGVCYQAKVSNVQVARIRTIRTGGGPLLASGSTATLSGGGGDVPQNLFQDHDPLTVANAPATLIGWANPQSDLATNVTINGNHSAGQQEILVRTPLPVSFTGGLTLTPSLLSGQLIDVQGSNAQTVSPGVYTMGAGSMTYEYTALGSTQFHASTLTIGQIVNLNQIIPASNTGQAFVDANHLQVKLYNWQKDTWDTFTLSQYMVTVQNAQVYVSSANRVLVQLVNTDTTPKGMTVFNKPLLQLQGTL